MDLFTNRVPPGVDESAYVKAAFLSDVAKGAASSPIIDRVKAVEILGQMYVLSSLFLFLLLRSSVLIYYNAHPPLPPSLPPSACFMVRFYNCSKFSFEVCCCGVAFELTSRASPHTPFRSPPLLRSPSSRHRHKGTAATMLQRLSKPSRTTSLRQLQRLR